jgi:hypothetical protein
MKNRVGTLSRVRSSLRFALPGIVFGVAYALSAAYSAANDGNGRVATTPAPAPGSTRGSTPVWHPAYPTDDLSSDVTSRLHGCQKVSYTAIGNFLSARGVTSVGSASAPANSAGQLYAAAATTFGIPTLDSRSREPSFLTTAGASKVFDIFVAAAPEIIANLGSATQAPACTVSGTNSPMFDSPTACDQNSVTCLLGRPATPNDMILCNLALSEADPNNPSDVTNKQVIAVATLLASAHLCE